MVEEKEFLIEEKDAQIMVLEERGVDLENPSEESPIKRDLQNIYSFMALCVVCGSVYGHAQI